MQAATLIPLFIALPLAVALLIQLVARRHPAASDWLANAAMLGLTALSFVSIGSTGLYHMGSWPTPIGIDLRLDALASLLLIAINFVGFAAVLYSVEYMRSYTAKSQYYGLFLLMVVGMNGVVLAGDLFNLYVFLEVAAVASYALVAFGGQHEELEASFKYAVLGTLSSTFILIGIALVYGVTGTLNMAHIASSIAGSAASAPLLLAFGFFLSGFGLKAALVPFHAWLPDAHPSAPAPVSAMLSSVLIKAVGIYVLARLAFNVFGVGDTELAVLRWLGIFSMVVAGLLAIGQNDIKRLFAYSSISQVGFMVLGLGLGTPLGIVGALFHLINHAAFKSLLFLNAGTIEHVTGTRNLDELGALNKALPMTGVTSLVGSLSIAGIPPLNGFWSKLIIVLACVEADFYVFAGVAIAVSVMTLAYQLKVQRHAFFSALPVAATSWRREPRLMSAATVLLAGTCLVLPFLLVAGLRTPLLIGPAQQALLAGVFGF